MRFRIELLVIRICVFCVGYLLFDIDRFAVY